MHKEGVNLELDNCDSLQINIIKLKKHFQSEIALPPSDFNFFL